MSDEGLDEAAIAAICRRFSARVAMSPERCTEYFMITVQPEQKPQHKSSKQDEQMVTVKAFDKDYKVRRSSLVRLPYFTAALSSKWGGEHLNELSVSPSSADANITRHAFETALRLSNANCSTVLEASAEEALALFATGNWLGWSSLVDATLHSLLDQMDLSQPGFWLEAMAADGLGPSSKLITNRIKALLCRHGAEARLSLWDDIPAEVIRDVVSSDAFVIDSEYSRFKLLKRILDRRLAIESPEHVQPVKLTYATRLGPAYRRRKNGGQVHLPVYDSAFIVPLAEALDHGVYYTHMQSHELREISNVTDILGRSVLPYHIQFQHQRRQATFRKHLLRTALRSMINPEQRPLSLGLMYGHHYLPYEERHPLPRLFVGSESKKSFQQWQPHWVGQYEKHKPHSTQTAKAPRCLYSNMAPMRFSYTLASLSELYEADECVKSPSVFFAGSVWRLRIQLSVKKDDQQPVRIILERHRPDGPRHRLLQDVYPCDYMDYRDTIEVRYRICIFPSGGGSPSEHNGHAYTEPWHGFDEYDYKQLRLEKSWMGDDSKKQLGEVKTEAARGDESIMFTVALYVM